MESALDVLSKAAHFVENQEKQNEATSNAASNNPHHDSSTADQVPLDCSRKPAAKTSMSSSEKPQNHNVPGMLCCLMHVLSIVKTFNIVCVSAVYLLVI